MKYLPKFLYNANQVSINVQIFNDEGAIVENRIADQTFTSPPSEQAVDDICKEVLRSYNEEQTKIEQQKTDYEQKANAKKATFAVLEAKFIEPREFIE